MINPEHYFILCTGEKIKNLEELISYLKKMDKKTFEYHVNEQKNDFANWIKYVFKNSILAEKISDLRYTEKRIIEKHIKKFLNEKKILVVNTGSSSIKFQIIELTSKDMLIKGQIEGINQNNCKITTWIRDNIETRNIIIKNHEEAINLMIETILSYNIIGDLSEIKAVAHRVVHGGEKYTKPTIINEEVIEQLTQISSLAPLHNPSNIIGIQICVRTIKAPQVAVFDTAFHSTIPIEKYLYGLPYEFYEKHRIRKYGFHGSSHKYITKIISEYFRIKKKKNPKIIICHLGNGCSITAVKNGKSINNSMGFTPVDGLIMGTRVGSIDPIISIHLGNHLNLDYASLSELFNKKSGLLGISGYSDMREIWKNKRDKRCQLAMKMFCDRIIHYIGAYTAELNGVDGIVFTGGIGENAWYIRKNVLENLKFLGIKIDYKKNKNNDFIITQKNSKIECFVLKTNEELQIAMEAAKLLKL